MLPDERLRDFLSRNAPGGSELPLDFDRSTLEVFCQSILEDSSHLVRAKFIQDAEHFVKNTDFPASAIPSGRSFRRTLNDYMPPEFATKKLDDKELCISNDFEIDDGDDDDDDDEDIVSNLRSCATNMSKKFNKQDPRQDDVIDYFEDGFWDQKIARASTSKVLANIFEADDSIVTASAPEKTDEAVCDEAEEESNGDDGERDVEEDYPLPQAFKDKVDLLIHLGFEDKPRVIEVLIENAGKIEDTADQLRAERKELLEKKKMEARQELMTFLDTEKGDDLLEKLAELSLAGNPDVLANLFAIAKSD